MPPDARTATCIRTPGSGNGGGIDACSFASGVTQSGPSSHANCFVADTPVATSVGHVSIQELQIGQRVITFTESERAQFGRTPETSIVPPLWRVVTIHIDYPNGQSVRSSMLRSVDWIEDYGAHVGGSVFLDMPEMGVEGEAQVLAIKPCPLLEAGEGRLVTATFQHEGGTTYDLHLEGEIDSIGVTALHPIWSVDRRAWVAPVDFDREERVKGVTTSPRVTQVTRRATSETVFNIEVEGEHVYRIGAAKLLVHNASVNSCSELAGASPHEQDEFLRHAMAECRAHLPPRGRVTIALAICNDCPPYCTVAFSWNYDEAADCERRPALLLQFERDRERALRCAEEKGFVHVRSPVGDEYFVHAERQIVEACGTVCSIIASNRICRRDPCRPNQVIDPCDEVLQTTPNCDGGQGPRRPGEGR